VTHSDELMAMNIKITHCRVWWDVVLFSP